MEAKINENSNLIGEYGFFCLLVLNKYTTIKTKILRAFYVSHMTKIL